MTASKRSMTRARDRRVKEKAKRLKWAESKVFRWLERRWADELRGREIPAEMKKRMRKDGAFRQLAQRVLDGEDLVALDLERTPQIITNLDGSHNDVMMDELGDDPERYICSECLEPLDERHDGDDPPVCQRCRDYFATGVKGARR